MNDLEFPPIALEDIWAPTAPMMTWADDEQPAPELSPCPWGFEMLGADCVIVHGDGRQVDAKLMQWDPANNRCLFQSMPDYVEITSSISRLRSVTLSRVQSAGSGLGAIDLGGGGLRTETLVFQIEFADGSELKGVSLGCVDRPEGHYLSRRLGTGGTSVRMFIPRQAVTNASFEGLQVEKGPRPVARPPTTQIARFEPVTSATQLRAAVAAQSNMPVLRIGDVLVSLGLLSVDQLAKALSQTGPSAALPLGERLLRTGLVSPEDLQRALHMKMGYPVVDVRRFPVDKEALQRLPYARALELRVLPVAFVDDCIVVVMADPGRIKALDELKFILRAPIIPALSWNEPIEPVLKEAYGVRNVNGSDVGWFG